MSKRKAIVKFYKYDNSMKSNIFSLVNEGKSESDICLLLGISRMTLNRWKEKDSMLQKGIDKFRDIYLRSSVEKALLAKSLGLTVDEVTEESIEIRKRPNGEEYPVKIKKVRKQLPPDMKALDRYIKKYMPELSETSQSQVTIKIDNVESMSFRELLEYNKDNNVIDSVASEVESNDNEDIEVIECDDAAYNDVNLDPPSAE